MAQCKPPPEALEEPTLDDRIDRLVAMLEARSEREERLVRALEGLVICEQRKLTQEVHNKARAAGKAGSGPRNEAAAQEVRRRLAKYRSKHP
jgi:hypothetical protein